MTSLNLVALPNAIFNGASQFDPKPSISLIAILDSTAIRDQLHLTSKQDSTIEQHRARLNELLLNCTLFPESREFRNGLGEEFAKSDNLLTATLTGRQTELLLAQREFFRFRQGVVLDEIDVANVHEWLYNGRFWRDIEEPSRRARKRAVEEVLSLLTREQVASLKKLVGEELLFGTRTRNDILYEQLVFEYRLGPTKGGKTSSFRDLAWIGSYVLRPDGKTYFRYFAEDDASVPLMAKLRLLSHPKFHKRLEMVDFQIEEIDGLGDKLNKVQRELTTEALKKLGDLEFVTADQLADASDVKTHPRFIAAENQATKELEDVLLPHQKELITEQLGVELVGLLGIRWALTRGTIGERLEVTSEQRHKIDEHANVAAKQLAETSAALEVLLFRMLEAINREAFVRIRQRILVDGTCAYPEAFLPLQLFMDEFGRKAVVASVYDMRTQYVGEARSTLP
ncbi:MAG: hypothetical protein O3C40_23665 [Planctomycetota bacterium]|nr:hypothetical protein [Planctomycetota bacterium]